VKIVWIAVLLCLLSIVAYSGFSDSLSGSGRARFEMPASPSVAATLPSLNTTVGSVAFDASSGRPAPGATRNDDRLADNVAQYVFLHKTWNESLSAPATGAVSVCPE
jgi:hypothetical protein